MVRLEAALDSWKAVRADTAQAWLDMPAADEGFRPTPDLMAYRDLAVHIMNAGRGIARMVLAGETDFSAPGFRDRMREHYVDASGFDRDTLAAMLQQAIDEDASLLKTRDAAFFAGLMRRFDGVEVTRLEMLLYAKEHELTHRSQMFMYLRLKGIVPPTTRRRLAQQQKK